MTARMDMSARRVLAISAGTALAGAMLSGPVSLWLVAATHPQPVWQGVAVFKASYHPIQAVPYVLGTLLVGGLASMIAALHQLAPANARTRSGIAVVFAAAFAAMVFTNYAIQITVVPGLMASPVVADADSIALLTMSNPASIGWGLEMWGYALLGVATWFAAGTFGNSRLERLAASLFSMNGIVSVGAALYSAVRPAWVLTTMGIVNFAVWNVLIVTMLGVTLVVAGRVGHASEQA